MNNTLYTDLAPLGFAEWLEKNYYGSLINEWIVEVDKSTIYSFDRTVLNASPFVG